MEEPEPQDPCHPPGEIPSIEMLREQAIKKERNGALIARWIKENEAELARALRPLAFKISEARGQSAAETTLDLLVEVTGSAMTTAERYDPERSLHHWLLGIARNVLLQWRDQSIKRNQRLIPLTSESMDDNLSSTDLFERTRRAAALEAGNLWIKQALAMLKPLDSKIITLMCIEQRDAAETGEILHIDAGTARVRLSRALRRLRIALTEDEARALHGVGTERGKQ